MAVLRIEIDLDAIDGNTNTVQMLLMHEIEGLQGYRTKKLTEYETATDPEPFMMENRATFKDGTSKVISRLEVLLTEKFDTRQQIEQVRERTYYAVAVPRTSELKPTEEKDN